MNIFEFSGLEIRSVVKVENKQTGSQYIQYNKFIDFYQLIYVLNGKAEVVFDDTVIINNPGTIVFLPKGQCKEYCAKILDDETCIGIFFDADFKATPTLVSEMLNKNANLSVLFEKMCRIWLRKEVGYYNKCMSLFYSIMAEIELSMSKYMPSNKGKKIDCAVEYIQEHYTDSNFRYDKLHILCGISYTYFKQLFEERFFMTPSEYVSNLKIQHACELLISKLFSVSEVAGLCGFLDISYFSKVFKKQMGICPSEYMKNAHLYR